MNETTTVSEIRCYPIKSCAGVSLQTAEVGRMGIKYDRQWMVVDANGTFVSKREITMMSQIKVIFSPNQDYLYVNAQNMSTLMIPTQGFPGEFLEVKVWDTICTAIEQGKKVNDWFTKFLSRTKPGHYRLVRMPDNYERIGSDGVSNLAFADGYPFLFLSQASIDDLNSKLTDKLPANRFRTNILLDGCIPYFEDSMDTCRIGTVSFTGKTLCPRCPITTTNQKTSEHAKEPLRTLATYRKTDAGVVFARNFVHENQGIISVGDIVHC